jgi:hypothetical protein
LLGDTFLTIAGVASAERVAAAEPVDGAIKIRAAAEPAITFEKFILQLSLSVIC